jgi:hypothetical protein
MTYGKWQTLLLAAWLYNVPGLIVGGLLGWWLG